MSSSNLPQKWCDLPNEVLYLILNEPDVDSETTWLARFGIDKASRRAFWTPEMAARIILARFNGDVQRAIVFAARGLEEFRHSSKHHEVLANAFEILLDDFLSRETVQHGILLRYSLFLTTLSEQGSVSALERLDDSVDFDIIHLKNILTGGFQGGSVACVRWVAEIIQDRASNDDPFHVFSTAKMLFWQAFENGDVDIMDALKQGMRYTDFVSLNELSKNLMELSNYGGGSNSVVPLVSAKYLIALGDTMMMPPTDDDSYRDFGLILTKIACFAILAGVAEADIRRFGARYDDCLYFVVLFACSLNNAIPDELVDAISTPGRLVLIAYGCFASFHLTVLVKEYSLTRNGLRLGAKAAMSRVRDRTMMTLDGSSDDDSTICQCVLDLMMMSDDDDTENEDMILDIISARKKLAEDVKILAVAIERGFDRVVDKCLPLALKTPHHRMTAIASAQASTRLKDVDALWPTLLGGDGSLFASARNFAIVTDLVIQAKVKGIREACRKHARPDLAELLWPESR